MTHKVFYLNQISRPVPGCVQKWGKFYMLSNIRDPRRAAAFQIMAHSARDAWKKISK